MPAEVAMDVIIQAAPTDWISPPRFEMELAIHTERNTGKRIGDSADGEISEDCEEGTAWVIDPL
jgi:hypothetical protein